MIANVLLALLAEPQSMLAFTLLTFAAGMYPVGMFFGSVCGKCHTGCCACEAGQLPDTVTVAISGYNDEYVQGPDLAGLSFSSNYGSGAEGKVTAPSGDPAIDKGPISAVSVTSGGSGYAVLGRVAPTLTISDPYYGGGTGATFTPTLANTKNANGYDLWSLASVAASGGTGYADFEPLTITTAAGDTQVSLASAILFIDKSPPTLTLSGTATATIVLSNVSIYLDNPYYTVGSVAVTNGGSGYTEGQALTFLTAAGDVTLVNATATARVVHGTPVNVQYSESGAGTGAVLTPIFTLRPENEWPAPHKKTYSISSVTITNGGSGYSPDDYFEFSFESQIDGLVLTSIDGLITSVDESGAITSVSFSPGGRCAGSQTGELHSVLVTHHGNYYHEDPGALRVIVKDGGSYYREDASVAPYVAAVSVVVYFQQEPSIGSGAVLAATIDDDTASAGFGTITEVTITDGGSDYLAWAWRVNECCADYWNGMSVVLKRNQTGAYGLPAHPCTFSHHLCGTGCASTVVVTYNGPEQPPLVYITGTCGEFLGATSPPLVADCSDLSFTATHENGVTYAVTPGGEYVETFKAGDASNNCFSCCRGDSPAPAEIEVEVTWLGDPIGYNYTDTLGTLVLSRWLMDGGCSSMWSIVLPNNIYGPIGSIGTNPRVVVQIGHCDIAATPQHGGNPYSVECDHCWKKCQTTAWVDFSGGYPYGTTFLYSESCESCADSPTCEPASGAYVCDGLYQPSGYGWIFQSWTVTVL